MRFPTPQQVREIAAAAICDERTIRRAYRTPTKVRHASYERIARAALRLGIDPPASPVRKVEAA